jgi:hypothetical protein
MSSAYLDFGNDLYTYLAGIDITAIEPLGWAHTFNRPFEPDEVTAGGYPTLMVVPARDQGSTIDSYTDSDAVTYWAYIYYPVRDVMLDDAETKLRQLVDLIRTQVRHERIVAVSLGGADTYDIQIQGEWGYDTERGERFYRLETTANISDTLV